MRFISCIIVLKFLTEIPIIDCSNNITLIAVVQIFRHGQRTPVKFYSNDPFSDSSNWGGLKAGELTQEGKRQLFDLGKFTRRRYKFWLPEEYKANDFIAWSTNVNRTYLSTVYNIKGLYPSTKQGFIPIYLADPDILHIKVLKTCNSYIVETVNFMTRNESVQYFSDVFKLLTAKSGDNVTTIIDINLIYDCLKCESDVGLTLPSWSANVFPEPLRQVKGLFLDCFSHSTKQQRMFMGRWLKEVLEYLENMAKNSSSSQKFRMYGGHDTNLACVLNMFKAYNPPFPIDFSSSMYFELNLINGHYYINVWYKDNHGFRPIKIRECDFDCPLEDIRKILQNVIVDVLVRKAECSEFVKFNSELAKDLYKKYRNKVL